MEKNFGEQNIMRFVGKRGTILIVDTRGFHKGEKLINGKRLLFQIEFSNSLFGMNYDLLSKDNIPVHKRDKFYNESETYLKIFN